MPIRPRSGRSRVVRQRKSCSTSAALGMLEAEDLAALRVDPGHHVADRSVLSRRIHRLKDQKDGIAVWMRREAAGARSIGRCGLPGVRW